MVAWLLPVAAKLLSGLLTGWLPCLSPRVSPVTSACDSFSPLPNVKLSSSPTPPSLFFPTARMLLYPYSSSTAALKSVPFLVSAPSVSNPLLCPHLSCLLSLPAFFFLLLPISDFVLCLLFVHLPVPLGSCLFYVQPCFLAPLNPCAPFSQLASFSLVGCGCLSVSLRCLLTGHSQKLLGEAGLELSSF